MTLAEIEALLAKWEHCSVVVKRGSDLHLRAAAFAFVLPADGGKQRLIWIEPFIQDEAQPMPIGHESDGRVIAASDSGIAFEESIVGFSTLLGDYHGSEREDAIVQWRGSRSSAEIARERAAWRARIDAGDY